jgi:AraC family transcriptional regulator
MDRTRPITWGRKISTIQAGNCVATDHIISPEFVVDCHTHDHPVIAFTVEGTFAQRFRTRSYECRPLGLLVTPAGESHSNLYSADGARCVVVELTGSRLDWIQSACPVLNEPDYVESPRLHWLASRLNLEMLLPDSIAPLAIESLTLELIAETFRSGLRFGRALPGWLRKAIEVLHSSRAESVSLSSLAAIVDIHPVHLARTFRRHYRCSVGDYVRNLRIARASDAVRTTDRPLAEIALEAGFCDQSHFTKMFKRYTGITPFQLRSRTRRSPR